MSFLRASASTARVLYCARPVVMSRSTVSVKSLSETMSCSPNIRLQSNPHAQGAMSPIPSSSFSTSSSSPLPSAISLTKSSLLSTNNTRGVAFLFSMDTVVTSWDDDGT